MYFNNDTIIISASSDGEVKVRFFSSYELAKIKNKKNCFQTWDYTTGSCLSTTKPQDNLTVQLLLPIPNNINHFIAVNKSNQLSVLNQKGKLIKTIGYKGAKDFVTATISHQGKLAYAVSEDSIMYCFDISTGTLVGQSTLCKSEVIGISSHPFSNVIASNDEAGYIYLLKSE